MRKFGLAGVVAVLVLLTVITVLFIRGRTGRPISYRGKPLSYWCDHLPCTDPSGGFVAVTIRSLAATPGERIRIRELEEESMAAINVMGTNCMPELLRRLRERPSEVQIQWTQFLIKFGVMKPAPVAPWDRRRMQALTAIMELNDPCFEPELNLMVKDQDAWIRRAGICAKVRLAWVNREIGK